MRAYRMRGPGLYDDRDRKIATARGQAIFDASNRQVAEIRGDDLYDMEDRIMMTVRGPDIHDSDNTKVALLSDVCKSIEGALEGMTHVALWYCFVR